MERLSSSARSSGMPPSMVSQKGGPGFSSWTVETSPGRSRKTIHQLCKLKIALMMRGTNPDWQYKYRPKHVIHDELCMVLQKRAFLIQSTIITSRDSIDSKTVLYSSSAAASSKECYNCGYDVKEISLKEYDNKNPNHVVVHELAFGPDSDPQVSRPVSIWFNIGSQNISEWSTTQAKRFRWKRSINRKDSPVLSKSTLTSPSPSTETHSNSFSHSANPSSAFNYIENFVMIRPHDGDAYELATSILEHRIAYMTRELIPNISQRYNALQEIEDAKKVLQKRFENLRRHWLSWSWPINAGRENVTNKSPVPPVHGKYRLPAQPTEPEESVINESIDDDEVDFEEVGSQLPRIWKGFVDQGSLGPFNEEVRG